MKKNAVKTGFKIESDEYKRRSVSGGMLQDYILRVERYVLVIGNCFGEAQAAVQHLGRAKQSIFGYLLFGYCDYN